MKSIRPLMRTSLSLYTNKLVRNSVSDVIYSSNYDSINHPILQSVFIPVIASVKRAIEEDI